MRTKILFLICFALVIGAVCGAAAMKLIEARKTADRMRFAQELVLISYGQRAFDTYRRDPAETGIVALQFHLRDLESRTNWHGPTLYAQDINWWQALAHARLSLLYRKTSKPELSSNHVSRALQFLEPGKVARTLPTDADGLMRWVQDADRRNSWL
jgi:hypothetical protein